MVMEEFVARSIGLSVIISGLLFCMWLVIHACAAILVKWLEKGHDDSPDAEGREE